LGGVNDELIAPNQTTFFRGSHILEFVVSAHKIIHDDVQRKKTGFIFKLDYEKAYDRVDRSFMLKKWWHKEALVLSLWKKFVSLMHKCYVEVNSHYFEVSRG
jgi:hypothetical protein